MNSQTKVFGIGMSKTGTTTLGSCLEMLGVLPHIGFEPQLKKWVQSGKDLERVMTFAERYRAFEDSPWYLVYRELDRRFPGSKFVLTVRKDSMTHAKSSWSHGVRRGQRNGTPTAAYIDEKIRVYEAHNNAVFDYFRDRPNDLLVMCWENGDSWEKLCPFLELPLISAPIPHANKGRYQPRIPSFISGSRPYNVLVRTVHRISLTPAARQLRNLFQGSSRGDSSSTESSSTGARHTGVR